LFGAEVSFDSEPYPYPRAEVLNSDFVEVFDRLLREVWKGITNAPNVGGENATDDPAIQQLVVRLQEMLLARRRVGAALALEEEMAVNTAQWVELSFLAPSFAATALNALAPSPGQRLGQMGSLVGLAPHSRTDAYLALAHPISDLLLDIEAGVIVAAGPVGVRPWSGQLYMPAGGWTADMQTIITNWSTITGRDIKGKQQLQLMRPAA
jgi:hypothetical protein